MIRLLDAIPADVLPAFRYDAGMVKLTGHRRPLLPCAQCGAPILRAGTAARFCGNDCYHLSRKGVALRPEVVAARNVRAGADHPDWLGDAVSVRGGRTRAERLFPHIGPCVRCGAAKAERHHIDANTANNDSTNIEALCRRCHMLKDGRLAVQIAGARERQKGARELAAALKRDRIRCVNGHVWMTAGWRTKSNGARICKECERDYKARYVAKQALQCR